MNDEQKRAIKEWCFECNFMLEAQEKKLLESHPELKAMWQFKALVTDDVGMQQYFQTYEAEELIPFRQMPSIQRLPIPDKE